MSTITAKIGDKTITTAKSVRYLVVAREVGAVLSHHFSFSAATSNLKRKQPHWVRRVYEARETIPLYVYGLNSDQTEWRLLDNNGHDYFAPEAL